MRRLRILTALPVAAALLLVWTGAPGAEVVTRPPVVEITTWRPVVPKTLDRPARGPIIKGHRVGLFIEGGYCLGGSKPEFDHVDLVELPRTAARPFRAAIITAYRVWPESSYETVGAGDTRCLPVRRAIYHRVKTKRPAEGLRLYDGYFSPPKLVWPPRRARNPQVRGAA